ncbi:MAG: hypothetical protein DMF39_03350 [Verrucomicrobia bacterium]|nr:MAG: hypothetical protein DMF39_03350 [Verrucomicrobiota bacterium]
MGRKPVLSVQLSTSGFRIIPKICGIGFQPIDWQDDNDTCFRDVNICPAMFAIEVTSPNR